MDPNLIRLRPAEFKPNFRQQSYGITTIIVVGCGGTGGRLIPNLAQHITNHNTVIETRTNNTEYIKHKMRLVVVDMDTVEAKNLKRQNFYKFDIGRGKAEVMAERYAALYALEIEYFNEEFAKCDFTKNRNNHGQSDTNFIIFDCTDNKVARASIEDFSIGRGNNTTLISCGNEDTFGQVLVSTLNARRGGRHRTMLEEITKLTNTIESDLKDETMKTRKHNASTFPTLLEMFPGFKDTEKPSCTDMALQNDQSMPINMLVAQIAYNAFYDIVSGKGLNYYMVRCNINNTFATDYINNMLSLRNLYIAALFGTMAEGAEPIAIEYARTFNTWVRGTGDSIIEKTKDLGVLKYGILSAWVEYCQANYKQADFEKVVAAQADAKEELLAYLGGAK